MINRCDLNCQKTAFMPVFMTGLMTHACSLARSSEKKCKAHFLFQFLLHMTPRLREDVLELQKQAKLKNVIFSSQGAPKKSLGIYLHVKMLALKIYFLSFYNQNDRRSKNNSKRPKMHF